MRHHHRVDLLGDQRLAHAQSHSNWIGVHLNYGMFIGHSLVDVFRIEVQMLENRYKVTNAYLGDR